MPTHKKIIGLAAAAVLCALSPAARAQQQEDEQSYQDMLEQAMKSGGYSQQGRGSSWDARLKVISGSVMVKTVDSDEWSAITGEMPLDPNDVVKTSADGVAELYLDDKGAISLGRNTELEISSLDQEDAVFSLSYGYLAAKIKHFLNEKLKLSVRTPAAVCAVRGTEFAVEYSQLGKETGVAVFDEGRVAVTQAEDSGKDGQEYILEKNTEISFGPSQRRFRPGPIARMARHRSAVAVMKTRLAALKSWKPRSAARRAALRDQALKRKVIRRQIKDTTRPAKAVKKTRKAKALRGAKARPRRVQPADEGQEDAQE